MPVNLVNYEVSLRFKWENQLTALLVAIWMWGLASFVIVLTLGASRDLGNRLGRYYSSVERVAWVSLVTCFVAQFIILGLLS